MQQTHTNNATTDYSQVPIIQCAYELALTAQRLVLKFPKNLRYQLGDRLAQRTQDLFENTIKANFIRDAARTPYLYTLRNALGARPWRAKIGYTLRSRSPYFYLAPSADCS